MTDNPYAAEIQVFDMLGAEVLEADDIGTYAVELAGRGWRVFPLMGKVPAIANPHRRGTVERQRCKGECGLDGHGVHDATADPNVVGRWWGGQYADANIGLRLPANVFVLDIDPRNGGTESISNLTSACGDLPATLTAISGRGDGGMHRYYRRPVGSLTSKLLGGGIDIKTSAGYVVAPPSIHPVTGRPYTWIEAAIAEPPSWLINLVRPAIADPQVRTQVDGSFVVDGHIDGFWSQFVESRSVADRFSESRSWADVLEPRGWRCLDLDPDGDGARWLHPAATSACSATVRYGCLFVYSDNTLFEPTTASNPHGYTRFAAYALLEHGGDMSAAASALQLERGAR